MQRFINKRQTRKFVRPLRRNTIIHKVENTEAKTENPVADKVKKNIKNGKKTASSKKKNENTEINETKTEDDMDTVNNNVEKIKEIVDNDPKYPKRKVKIEKKDKGLFERTENSTILITEDNKMMLTD